MEEYYKDLELKQLTPEEKAVRDAAWVIKRKAYEKEYYAMEDIKQKKREYPKQSYIHILLQKRTLENQETCYSFERSGISGHCKNFLFSLTTLQLFQLS
jgi:hypothetical protein